MQKEFVKEVADINLDFPQWYTDVVKKAELADYGAARGTIIFRPYGYAIWENIQHELDKRIKAMGHENVYFPLFFPTSLLEKEAEHVAGFAPEVATITRGGKEELTETLVVRPTSETVFSTAYSQWVQSYRDLPMLYNQWANVVRWEKTTRPFLRTREFLWQEGHTIHATKEEAIKETLDILAMYKDFCRKFLAMDVLTGKKSEKEKFAGAVATYGMESMTLDGKSLQAGTSHFFGDNFARAYDIKYLDKSGKQQYVWQTSWGVSTRLIGALIMAHGDQRGLILPPKVAPTQVIVIPIASYKEGVQETAEKLVKMLNKANIRAKGDFTDQREGWKFNQYEMKGVPLRIEVGPRDIASNVMCCVRRDDYSKNNLPLYDIASVKKLLKTIQADMLTSSQNFMSSHLVRVDTLEEMGVALDGGNMTKACWCGCAECEAKIKEKFQASSRVMLKTDVNGKCICCGKSGKMIEMVFARAY
ncbi:MAG: proline--tRNA ligase [Clostridia bacterium]